MDEWLARVDDLARWYTQASEEARYALWQKAITEGSPSLTEVRVAAILSDEAAGKIGEG